MTALAPDDARLPVDGLSAEENGGRKCIAFDIRARLPLGLLDLLHPLEPRELVGNHRTTSGLELWSQTISLAATSRRCSSQTNHRGGLACRG